MIMHNDWDQLFDQEIQKDYLLNLRYFLAKEYKTKNIYPAKENIFAAFKTTSLKDTKVVIFLHRTKYLMLLDIQSMKI